MEGLRAEEASAGVVIRHIADRELDFLQEILSAHNQEALFKGWVSLQAPDKALRDRIMVVSNFRVICLHVTELGSQIQENIPIMDLKEVFMDKTDPFFLCLRFREDTLNIVGPQCIQILEAVLFCHLSITHGIPDALLPTIRIPIAFIEEFTPPIPDEQTGLIASYLSICDYLEIPCRSQIIDYLITCFQSKNEELDLKNCLYYVEPKPTALDIDALTTALRFNNTFKKLVVQNIALTDESMDMIAKIFGYNDFITHLTLINLKTTKAGIAPFASSFSRGIHGLKSLKIVKFNIGDQGMELISNALERSKQPIKRLSLVDVGFTSKGFKDLFKLLSNKRWAKAIKTLDISDNRIGKSSGSQMLAAWLQEAQSLEEFSASFCDLDLEVVLESLKENNILITQTLETLNLSGNKISSACIVHLESILSSSVKLEHLYLGKTSMKRNFYESLFQSIKKNSNGGKFFLDLSNNDVGAQFGKSINAIFDVPCNSIYALVLMQNELGAEGIISLGRSLRNLTSLHTLILDVNASKGLFTKINEVGSALAGLCQDLPSLKVLSIAGDATHYLKSGLVPFFIYLVENRTLTHLNVQSNRLQDECFDALIEVVKKNQALQILDTDNNSWKLKHLRKLRDAMMLNNGLSHKSVIPFNDIATIYATYPKYQDEIHQLLTDVETKLSENERSTASKMASQDIKHRKKISWATGNFSFDNKISATLALDEIAFQKLEETKSGGDAMPLEESILQPVEEGKEEREGESGLNVLISSTSSIQQSESLDKTENTGVKQSRTSSRDKRESVSKSQISKTEIVKPESFKEVKVESNTETNKSEPMKDVKSERVKSSVRSSRKTSSATSPLRESVSRVQEKPPERSTLIQSDDVFAANNFSLEELKDARLYGLEDLKDKDASALPIGVIAKYKEMYLKDDVFQKVFDCTKEKFLALPRWKQVRKKRETGLF